MESKIAGYKLVPEIKACEGCYFQSIQNSSGEYLCQIKFLSENKDCFIHGAIYVPADTAIEVAKINQQNQ